MSSIKTNTVIVLIGKRNSGKSTLIKDIMYHQRKIPAGCVINATEEANSFYSDFVPSILIKDTYRTEHLANLLKRQRGMLQKIQSGDRSVDPSAFLIMDDCLYDNKWVKDTKMRRIFMNGRHYKITYLLTMQYPLGIPPLLRTQIDYVFIMRELSPTNRKRIFENYAGVLPSFEIFSKVMDKLTADYGCMVIDNTVNTGNSWDQVRWYRANVKIPPFRMCDDLLWKMNHEVMQRRQREQEEQDGRADELQSLRKSPRVYVQKLLAQA